MSDNTFVYVTYIATTPEKLWEALTSSEFTKRYWFGQPLVSDWREGSRFQLFENNGNVANEGIVLKSEPCRLLSYTWHWLADPISRETPQRVTFELQPLGSTVRLTLRHGGLLPSDFYAEGEGFHGINNGWPAILSNLKTLLETGRTLEPISD